jgi:hypothetical protein
MPEAINFVDGRRQKVNKSKQNIIHIPQDSKQTASTKTGNRSDLYKISCSFSEVSFFCKSQLTANYL